MTTKRRTTAIHMDVELLDLLMMVAVTRASRRGGRASVSDVLRDLVASNRTTLEMEVAVGTFATVPTAVELERRAALKRTVLRMKNKEATDA